MQYKIKNFSSLPLHPDYRWDGEYMCFEPYKNEGLKYVAIGRTLRSSQYGVSIDMNEEGRGTKIYRMNEIASIICDLAVSKYAELEPNEASAYRLNDKDVLFNRTNSQTFVGRTGIFRQFSDEDIVFASYLVRVKPDPKVVLPEYLTAFLNTKYGLLDVKRRARISINQSNVNAEELKRVEIPLVCQDLQQSIALSFDKAFKLLEESSQLYTQAQIQLLSELELLEWRPEHSLAFEVNYSGTQQASRIDADYFQPKYGEVVNAIKNYPGGWDTIGNLVHMKAQNYLPENGLEYQYIELSNIGSSGEITGSMVELGRDLPSRARRMVATGDVIVSSIEGSLDSIALVDEEYNQALCSTGFHVINSKLLNSETLLVALKSLVGQLQLKQGSTGTILTAINKRAFNQVVLPVIAAKTQTQIQQMVTESALLRQESKRLLECAKRAVEIAIEQDEQTAIAWLENSAP